MNERMRSLLHIDSSMDSATILTRLLIWAVVLSVAAWVILGLVSLRFDLTGGLEDVFYSQLIIAGIFGIAIANAFIMGAGGFGGSGILARTPILWGLLAVAGMFMLVWQVWVDFEGGPNEMLKVMYSLLGVGLCGTYAGFVSLPSIERTYRLLRWAMYLLTFILAVEIIEALWREEVLSGVGAGREFAKVAMAVGILLVVYALVAAATARADTLTRAVVIYAGVGLFGFGLVLVRLWEQLDAGPLRFVLGASSLLAISTMGLVLMHYYEGGLPQSIRNLWETGKGSVTGAQRPEKEGET